MRRRLRRVHQNKCENHYGSSDQYSSFVIVVIFSRIYGVFRFSSTLQASRPLGNPNYVDPAALHVRGEFVESNLGTALDDRACRILRSELRIPPGDENEKCASVTNPGTTFTLTPATRKACGTHRPADAHDR